MKLSLQPRKGVGQGQAEAIRIKQREWRRTDTKSAWPQSGREYGGRKAKNGMLGTKILQGFEHRALVFKRSSAGSRELKASEQVGT